MYEVKREGGRVIVNRSAAGDRPRTVYNTAEDAYVVYQANGANTVTKVKDLPDAQLLLALASAVIIGPE